MVIGGVDLGNNDISDDIHVIEYRYRLEYIGDGYGVSEMHVSSDYKYMYRDEHTGGNYLNVQLMFPQTAVGISVKTQPDSFAAIGDETHVFNITGNDKFAEMLDGDAYNVLESMVIFTDAAGNPLFKIDENTNSLVPADPSNTETRMVGGNQQIDNDLYTASITRGVWQLQFTSKVGAPDDEHVFYYKIMLTATKPGSHSFVLDSGNTEVKINVSGVSPLMLPIVFDMLSVSGNELSVSGNELLMPDDEEELAEADGSDETDSVDDTDVDGTDEADDADDTADSSGPSVADGTDEPPDREEPSGADELPDGDEPPDAGEPPSADDSLVIGLPPDQFRWEESDDEDE
jgi:hypothetical protein